jgi:hypothetical protein
MKRTSIKKSIFTLLATVFCVANAFAQTAITTGALSPTEVCVGGNVSVPFTTEGTVAPLTSFVAQLSDATGAFTSPVVIGAAAATPITATIPAATTPGAAYKIRVVSVLVAATVATGSESGALKVNAIPGKPGVTSPVAYEQDAKAVALTAEGAGLKWYDAASGGDGSATAPVPSTTKEGSTSYFVSQTVGGCESGRAEIVVNVTAVACTQPAKPGVTSPISYTKDEKAVPLTAAALTGATLNWYDSQGKALATAPTPLTNAIGETTYYVSQTLKDCESERAAIVVNVSAAACVKPAKPGVTSPISYTKDEKAVPLTATALTGATLNWYDSQGKALATAPTPLTNAIGETTYYVSQTLKDCESERAAIVVDVNACVPPAKPTATNPPAFCQGGPAVPLTATALSGYTLRWYVDGNTTTALPGAPTPKTDATTPQSYFVSQVAPNGCESQRTEIVITVKTAPSKPTTDRFVAYCKDATTAKALSANGTALKWYNDKKQSIPADPKPSTATVGDVFYAVSQTVNGCESDTARIKVTVNPLPAVAVVTPEAICQENSDKTIQFSASGADGNTFNWYKDPTGGTKESVVPSVPLKTAIEKTYYVTQVSPGGCESPTRVAKKIRVKPLPALPGIEKPLVEICQFVAAQPLTATPVKDGILKWYGTNATGGDPSDAAPVPSTAEGGTTSYYVGQALEGCFSDRAKIDVKINTTPKPQTTTALAYCQNAVAPRLDATGSILKWYRNATDTEFQGIPFTPFTEKVQDYSFYVTQTGANGCESPKEEIKIHIKALPSATISGNSTIDLGETAAIKIRFTGDGPWMYALSNGMTDTTDQADHEITVKPTTTTTYLLTEVANACGKGTPIGSALVTVKVPTINSGNPSVAEACAGKTFNVPFQQSGDFPAENSFKVQIATVNADANFKSIPSIATSSSVTATFPDTTLAGSYFVRVISSGTNPAFTVKGSVSSITITASPLPVATISGTQTILVGDKADMKIETTGKAPWTFTLNNGTKDSLITASVTPYTFKLAPRVTTTYTISKVTNGCGTGKGAGSARVQVDPILGVEPPASADWVKVYPTLVTSQLTVEITNAIAPKAANAEIIDMNGRSRSIKNINQKTTEVDFSGYASGLYLLRVKNGNKNTVIRILKP